MTHHRWTRRMLLGCLALLSAASASAAAPAAAAASKPAATQGVRHVPAFDLPVSEYLSPAARAQVSGDVDRGDPLAKADNATLLRQLPTIRADTERWAAGVIAQMRTRYAVEITPEQWNGVPVLRVQPRTRTPEQAKRLLIELHGGGFVMGSAASFGLMEAIPVAAMTGITVVAVDYRMGPEHQFPAASEDVAAVYRAALKTYTPAQLGLFGCSAGGVLTGEALAWFAKEQLPMPAAAGLFCAAGDARYRGDSQRVVAAVNDALLPDVAGTLPIMEDLYYGPDVDFRDPAGIAGVLRCGAAPVPAYLADHRHTRSRVEQCVLYARAAGGSGARVGPACLGRLGPCLPSHRHAAREPAGLAGDGALFQQASGPAAAATTGGTLTRHTHRLPAVLTSACLG